MCLYVYNSLILSYHFWFSIYFSNKTIISTFIFISIFILYLSFISNILQWTPSYGRTKAGQPARTYIKQLCADTGYNLENLPGMMDDRDWWQERVREIHAGRAKWWWYISSSSHAANAYFSWLSFAICPNHPNLQTQNVFSRKEWFDKPPLHVFM